MDDRGFLWQSAIDPSAMASTSSSLSSSAAANANDGVGAAATTSQQRRTTSSGHIGTSGQGSSGQHHPRRSQSQQIYTQQLSGQSPPDTSTSTMAATSGSTPRNVSYPPPPSTRSLASSSRSSHLRRPEDAITLSEARFLTAVDIIQKLPKSGPLPTSYEEKLMLYSLYKQATEGPVKTSRPGLLDMLGRAKWDAWKKREKLTRQEAQESYVETLIGVLRTLRDRPQAVDALRQLASIGKSGNRTPTSNNMQGRVEEEGTLTEASETSSHRSTSPPPSRRSYHSALPDQMQPLRRNADLDAADGGDETPKRHSRSSGRNQPQQQFQQERKVYNDDTSDDDDDYSTEEGEDEDDQYTQSEEEEQIERHDREHHARIQRHSGTHHRQRTLSGGAGRSGDGLQLANVSRRLTGPSPYQHPAQYPAPVQAQLPADIPPIHPSARERESTVRSFSSALPSADPASHVFPDEVPRSAHLAGRSGPGLISTAEIPLVTASGTLLPPTSARSQQLHDMQHAQLQNSLNIQQQQQQRTLERALDSIQTSLTALHERLHLMENIQNDLQAQAAGTSLGGSLSAWIAASPVLQLLRVFFRRLFVVLRFRSPDATGRGTRMGQNARTSLTSLMGQALISLLVGARSLARDAVAIIVLASAVASLRSARGDRRAVIRAWARILALAGGIGLARETTLLSNAV